MSEKIYVLHILTTLVSGGVQKVVLNYGMYLRKYGVIFDYVVQGKGNEEIERQCIEDGSRIYYLPSMTKHAIQFSRELRKLLKEHPEYRIIQSHQNFLNAIPLLVANIARVPIRISHSHTNRPIAKVSTKILRTVSRALLLLVSTDLWACSEAAYSWLYGRDRRKDDKHSYILFNSFDCHRFFFNYEKRQEMRAILGIDDTVFTCICVATLSEGKNQRFLLDVFAQLERLHLGRNLLLLVGDGSIRAQLEKYADDLGIHECVRFMGDRSDVPDLLDASDCFLLPSHFEGLSVSMVEAQINGLPCIVSDTVSPEVAISEQIWFEPISQGPQKKKKKLQEIRTPNGKYERKSLDSRSVAKFDIEITAKEVASKYWEMYNR